MTLSQRFSLAAASAALALALHLPTFAQSIPIYQSERALSHHWLKFTITDSGLGLAFRSAARGSAHTALQIGSNGSGNALLQLSAESGAFAKSVFFSRKGVLYEFPFTLSGIVGPGSSVIDNVSCFNNTAGSLLKDCNINKVALGFFANSYGADTGATDAATPVQNCLDAAGAGRTCNLDPGAIIKFLASVTIPAQTTLDCGATFADINSLTGPGIRLDATKTILFGGTNAKIKNCLIVPEGMRFPQSSGTGFLGTALDTQGNTSVEIENVEIVGFDTCINAYGSSRFRIERVYMDCAGVTNNGAFITGNEVDAGVARDVKMQAIGTAASCTARQRAGTGWYAHDSPAGGVFADNVVIQDFQTADYNIRLPGGPADGGPEGVPAKTGAASHNLRHVPSLAPTSWHARAAADYCLCPLAQSPGLPGRHWTACIAGRPTRTASSLSTWRRATRWYVRSSPLRAPRRVIAGGDGGPIGDDALAEGREGAAGSIGDPGV